MSFDSRSPLSVAVEAGLAKLHFGSKVVGVNRVELIQSLIEDLLPEDRKRICDAFYIDLDAVQKARTEKIVAAFDVCQPLFNNSAFHNDLVKNEKQKEAIVELEKEYTKGEDYYVNVEKYVRENIKSQKVQRTFTTLPNVVSCEESSCPRRQQCTLTFCVDNTPVGCIWLQIQENLSNPDYLRGLILSIVQKMKGVEETLENKFFF